MNPTPPPADSPRILLVDDNVSNLEILYQALEDEGYELLVAQSGEEALEVARDASPNLILLDINMPGLDGFETCRRLKASADTASAPVIFLSARGATQDKVRGLDAGAVDYIGKPFDFEEVVARVRKHLETHQRQTDLEARNRELEKIASGKFLRFDETSLRELIAAGESETLEFKSTLRWNLHTGKSGKEIENASLKTIAAFLNSNGGTLLVGVDDSGQPLGLKTDNFPNNDRLLLHLNNMIREYIGLGCADYINPSIVTAGGADVLVIQCLPCPTPVFFRRDKEEHFYIRSGPSTQSLSPSQLLAYIENRKTEQQRS